MSTTSYGLKPTACSAGLQRDAGVINASSTIGSQQPIDKQTVIRMNRYTLYRFAVSDISAGATLTVPDPRGLGVRPGCYDIAPRIPTYPRKPRGRR